MAALKLSSIKPVFEVEDPADPTQVKSCDPWELAAKLEGAVGIDSTCDIIRGAIGIPALTRHQCMEVQAAAMQFIADLDISKKARALSQSFAHMG